MDTNHFLDSFCTEFFLHIFKIDQLELNARGCQSFSFLPFFNFVLECLYPSLSQTVFESGMKSIVKQITSPGWMHETSARTWCTEKTQRDRVEREVGGGIGMGNTCISKADSCQCMTKTTTIL